MKKITKVQQKNFLQQKLSTSPQWAKAALLKVYDLQTESEQAAECTSESNGVGFSGTDGNFLSSLAVQLRTRRSLSEKQTVMVMKCMKKYWKQVLHMSDVEQLNSLILQAA